MAKIKGFNHVLLLFNIFVIAPPVSAFWRLMCHGQIGVARIDPLADYGMISDHAHAIHGANNFDFFSTADTVMASNCTSCSVTQDHSVYWTPPLYFQSDDDGTFTLVPQKGGMTVYYLTDKAPGEYIHAFPKGFSMISGDPRQRNATIPVPDPEKSFWGPNDTTQLALAQKAIGFNCLNYTPGYETEGSLEYHNLRDKTFIDLVCKDGVRGELMFPSCWNGELTSKNHKSHVQFPDLVQTGKCPAGFERRLPVIFYEVIFNTAVFANLPGRFVLANGDFTGWGYHGDFFAGWNETFLQEAIDTCNGSRGLQEDCPLFDLQDDGNATSCTMTLPDAIQDEDTHGPLSGLPGHHPIYSGPGYAPPCKGTPLSANAAVSTPDVMSSAVMAPSNSLLAPNVMPSSVSALSSASSVLTKMPPTVSTAAPGDPTGYSTTTYTTNGVEVVMIVVVEEVTVTTATTVTELAAKRHLSRHQHEHRHV